VTNVLLNRNIVLLSVTYVSLNISMNNIIIIIKNTSVDTINMTNF